MDLSRAAEVILLFIVVRNDEASLASFCKIQIRLKHSIFPGQAILLVNKIEPAERPYVSHFIINFANDNSVDRPTFISRKYTGNNDFNGTGSFFKISSDFNNTFSHIER